MSNFGGCRKIHGSWTKEEKEQLRAEWKASEKKTIQKKKLKGYDLQKVAIPLPDWGCLTKYKQDKSVRAFLAPYETINLLGLRTKQWEQLVLGMD